MAHDEGEFGHYNSTTGVLEKEGHWRIKSFFREYWWLIIPLFLFTVGLIFHK